MKRYGIIEVNMKYLTSYKYECSRLTFLLAELKGRKLLSYDRESHGNPNTFIPTRNIHYTYDDELTASNEENAETYTNHLIMNAL